MSLSSDIKQDIVRLRIDEKLSEKNISQCTGVSVYTVTNILKEQLKDKYTSFNEASPEEIKNIVVLRREYISLRRIARKLKFPYDRVVKILKDELGEDYSNYSARYKIWSTLQKRRMVRLRKRGYSLTYLMRKFEISKPLLIRILKEYMGDEYQNYNYKISSAVKNKIVRLFNEHYSYEGIAQLTNLAVNSIKNIVDTFDLIYDKIILKLQWKKNPDIKNECGILYDQIRNKIKKFTKYRAVPKLAPIIIFLFFRMKTLNISSKDFMNAADISSHQFRDGLKYIQQSFPGFFIRDQKALVTNTLNDLLLHFRFNSSFYQESIQLLNRFWPLIRNTKEEIIAAVICIFTMIKLNIRTPKYLTICKKLGITMSSTIYQVKHNIFGKLNNKNQFHGFKKSQALIEDLLKI